MAMRPGTFVLAMSVATAGLFLPSADAGIVRVVEYERIWGGTGFFVTALSAEIELLDTLAHGQTGLLRHRSGMQFSAHDAPGPGLAPVCRYYAPAVAPLGAHFYSPFSAECELLAARPEWISEGIAFYAALPDAGGVCPAATAPVYRVFDGRVHRLTYSSEIRATDQIDGAVAEGVGPDAVTFCVPVDADVASARLTEFARGTWTFELATGVFPWPESASFLPQPPAPGADDAQWPPFLGTHVSAWGSGLVGRVGRIGQQEAVRAAWQPYTGEIVIAFGASALVRLDYRGGDTVPGCWQAIYNTFDEPYFFWSLPCEPLVARRR